MTDKSKYANFFGTFMKEIKGNKEMEKYIEPVLEKVAEDFVNVINETKKITKDNIDQIIFNGGILPNNKQYKDIVYKNIKNILPNVKIILIDLNDTSDMTNESSNTLIKLALKEL
jgi:2-iminoacetate synthase ThiH